MSRDPLFLIDANALCYRSFYAIRGLSTSKGQATNAVFGFVNTINKILKDYDPKYFAVCFDVKGKTHRHEKFESYKIQRPAMPDDLVSQIPIIKKVIQAYGLPLFERQGFEADDLIATFVDYAMGQKWDVVIVSDDKDMFQLLNDQVKIFSSRKSKFLDKQAVEKLLGFSPRYMTDFIGLAGDKSDNIPGVRGVGEVSARNLISQFGDLENIYFHLEEISSKSLREKLRDQREDAFLSKELAQLENKALEQFENDQFKIKPADNGSLFEIFSQLELRKFAVEVSKNFCSDKDLECVELKTKKSVDQTLDKLPNGVRLAFMFEDNQDDENLDDKRPASLLFSYKKGEVFKVQSKQISAMKSCLADSKIPKITFNIKDQLKFLRVFGIEKVENVFDLFLAEYLLNPSRSQINVPGLAWQYTKIFLNDDAQIFEQVNILNELGESLKKILEERELLGLFHDIEIPLAYVLFAMETQGVVIDEKFLGKLSDECRKKIEALYSDLVEMAGEEFNLNSPKQLGKILFEKLKLPVIKRTKTGFSTDEEVLTRLAQKHALPAKILEYRQLAKLKSTYIDALPKLVDPETGCIHASFNQAGTETGRLSSNSPNLQNIPVRTDLGKQVRKAFVAVKKGDYLISADYSQIDLRVLAHLSKDEALIKAFSEGQDIHQFTASLVYDIDPKDVTKQMRNYAKRINFGIVYGMSSYGLAKDLKVPQKEAQAFIDTYFVRYPGVKKFMDDQIEFCEKQGYVVTLLNRRRYLPEIKSSNLQLRQFAQRQAINTPVQGSAADLFKIAMINIFKAIEREGLQTKMIMSVHDEIVFDMPAKEEKILVGIVKEKMEQVMSLAVPLTVSIKKGRNWLEMDKII